MTQFTIQTDGAVATVTLDREEKRNALALPFWEEFPAAIEDLDRSGDIRAIVIAANGPMFCAGIDLAAFSGVMGRRNALELCLAHQSWAGSVLGVHSSLRQTTQVSGSHRVVRSDG